MKFSHRKEDCYCTRYEPKIEQFEIRMNGKNYYCRGCGRYVDSTKWKGGIVNFGSRAVYKLPNFCPCCGVRMSLHRRSKKKMLESIKHQQEHPELHEKLAITKLPEKIKLLQENLLLPTVK